MELFQHIIDPESIVIVGASNNVSKPGGRVTQNIVRHGYTGQLWAVNSRRFSVMGLPTYERVDEIPEVPDLAIIAIPAKAVCGTLKSLVARGCRAAIVLTAGFGEVSEDGREEEHRLLKVADEAGMTLIGPNCMGVITPSYAGVFAGPIPELTPGKVDVVSGSGATAGFMIELAIERGLPLSCVITVGNAAQVAVEDILEMMDEDFGPQSARVKVLYMESIKKSAKLIRHARSLSSKGCSIVGVKAGATKAGSRAAASHTGAMATSDTVVQAVFDKAGIIRVASKKQLVDVAGTLLTTGVINGQRACVVTDAGGPGVMLVDELTKQSIEVPQLGDVTQAKLKEVLWPGSSVGNPIDCLSTRTAEQITRTLDIVADQELGNVDVIPLIMGDPGMGGIGEMYRAIGQAMDTSPIPVIPCLTSPVMSGAELAEFRDSGHFYFIEETDLGQALGKIIKRPCLSEPVNGLPKYDKDQIANALEGVAEQPGMLQTEAVFALLAAAGLTFPVQVVVTQEGQLASACRKVGFPLVMKVVGPLHKTDVGGVTLGVHDVWEARNSFEHLMSIADAKGVLMQRMIEGTELIIGATREGECGSLVMFGLGGVFTEVIRDVTFALAPLSMEECLKMINSIRGRRLLDGVRRGRPVDIDTLADIIARVGMLMTDFPQIKELDLNPVKGYGKDLYVVDARIIV